MLASTFSFSQTVTIVSPAEGATTSPVRVVANFSDNGSIAATSVLVDGTEVVQGGAVTPLDVTIPISPGSHEITVKAVDDDGKESSASRVVDVSAPETTMAAATVGSMTTDATTSGTVTYSKIEEKSGWYTYPDQGDPYCSAKPVLSTTPSLDGISGKFYIRPNGQYNNCLWPILLGKNTTATHFRLDVHYRLSNPSYPQGVEFSSNKHIGTKWYKFSVQCSYNKGVFSLYDQVQGKWIPTSIACKRPASGKWDHLIVNTEVSNGKAVFQSIVFNGVTHTLNKSFSPLTKSSSYNFGVHFQMDGNRVGNPYYTWVDQLTYKVW